ncbi:prepilin-type N-terminal cleavage/methylation domain-containing protein [Agarivorans aestuarii]|uniref:prepilin-type N-terminal cleavage/methylation domain-containing protein n=1 Tax=Agarivorans aestuarii TaxID=1563703 RepID=UPI001C801739|nr:prepilin-type N-terminal cleavage/methylation domain-containing protein [Agarivorans aestuarii]
MKNQGFTLIELVVVIIVIGILAVTAAPKLLNLSSDARIKTIEQISVSVKTANDLLTLKSYMPSYVSQQVPNRDDLIDVDMDGDGTFDVFNPDSPDVRLKWRYLDNTDITKRIDIDDVFVLQEQGFAFTYLGYDRNGNGQVTDDNCYFQYTQASNATTPPQYELVDDGC